MKGKDMHEHTSLIWALIDAIKQVYSSICLQSEVRKYFKKSTNGEVIQPWHSRHEVKLSLLCEGFKFYHHILLYRPKPVPCSFSYNLYYGTTMMIDAKL